MCVCVCCSCPKLPLSTLAALMAQYWGAGGIGYTVGRVPINSCDFSVRSYSFDNSEADFALKEFDHNVLHDQAAMIPMMRSAMATARTHGVDLRMFSSPW